MLPRRLLTAPPSMRRVAGAARKLATSASDPSKDNLAVWLNCKEAYPLLGILGGAVLMLGYKIFRDVTNPETRLSKSNRSTSGMDFIDAHEMEAWTRSFMHRGPAAIEPLKHRAPNQ